jgi:hypothetical protein
VNGAHNGVWLPGNYAIRRKTKLPKPIKGKSWSKLLQRPDWCFDYMVAVVRLKERQFHDAHTG